MSPSETDDASPGAPEPDTDSTPFKRALNSRQLRELRGTGVHRLIQQAADEVAEFGLVDELGALRIVLARLVTEQDDLKTLAADVTRVAAVAIRAAQVQRQLQGQAARELFALLDRVLADIEAARTAARTNLAGGKTLPPPRQGDSR